MAETFIGTILLVASGGFCAHVMVVKVRRRLVDHRTKQSYQALKRLQGLPPSNGV